MPYGRAPGFCLRTGWPAFFIGRNLVSEGWKGRALLRVSSRFHYLQPPLGSLSLLCSAEQSGRSSSLLSARAGTGAGWDLSQAEGFAQREGIGIKTGTIPS